MRYLKCSSCGRQLPAAQMFSYDDAPVCEPCGDRMVVEARAKGYKPDVRHMLDATICSRCKTDNGETDFRLIGGSPFCPRCGAALYAYPFPTWLKASFAALLLLLAFALWHDAPYFAAGRHLVAGRRDMARKDYRAAAVHYAMVLPVKPTDQEVVLLGAKASLMTGDVASAQQFLQLREKYEAGALFTEVNRLWNRALHAFAKADSAGKLAKANRTVEANRLMAEAAREYPESSPLVVGALLVKGGDAFERKDYDLFLSTSREALALMPDQPRLIAGVASALACKYALTGDATLRVQAESLLAVAGTIAQRSAEEKASYDEYAERIRHRLTSRTIIDQAEYNRRFRP